MYVFMFNSMIGLEYKVEEMINKRDLRRELVAANFKKMLSFGFVVGEQSAKAGCDKLFEFNLYN